MAGAPTDLADTVGHWTLTLTIAVSIGTIIVNAGIAAFNAQRTGALKRLDHFNTALRRPVELKLEKIEACCDDAEDFWLDQGNPPVTLEQLSRNFHAARRQLERIMQDAEKSDLIPGDHWFDFRDDVFDLAVTALDLAKTATKQQNAVEVERQLKEFRDNLLRLRRRILQKLDEEASKAVAFRLSLW